MKEDILKVVKNALEEDIKKIERRRAKETKAMQKGLSKLLN